MSKKVIIIEDDQDIREALLELLTIEGYEVMAAENGQMGLDQLRDAPNLPDLILLDLMMPVKDGFEFRNEQRQDPRLSGIPVVVMSADGQVREKLDRIGGAAYLKKPVDLDDLLKMVELHCAS